MRKERHRRRTSLAARFGIHLHEKKQRRDALRHIAEILQRNGTAFLSMPVEVSEDFLGDEAPLRVLKVSLPSGVQADGLDFLVGTDPFGNPVWTSHLVTADIIRIKDQIVN